VTESLVEQVRAVVAGAGRIEEVAGALAQLIRSGSGRRWFGIYRVNADVVVNVAWSGPAPPAHLRFSVDQGLTGDAIARRATVRSDDVANDPRYLTNQETTGSELIVPVLLDDAVVGTIDVEEPHRHAFSSEDERLFEEIAAVLSPLYA